MWNLRVPPKSDDGAAILELAVVVPFILSLAFGAFEFGNAIYNYHLMSVGVRDAARYLSGVDKNDSTNVTKAQNIAVYGNVGGTGSKRLASWAWNPGDVTVAYECYDNDQSVAGCSPNTTNPGNKIYRGGDSITVVTVSTSITYQDLGLLSFLGVGPITMSTSHEERYYGIR
jgi:Flp pilus assembly protein TadG